MAWNEKLLKLSTGAIEPYVGNYLVENRQNAKEYIPATDYEDKVLKIDLYIVSKDNVKCPVQVKTRERDSENFSLSEKDIKPEQENRVFAFVDKTFSSDVVDKLNEMNVEDVKELLKKENPHIYLCSQKQLINGKFKEKIKNGSSFYLIPKTFLT